MKNIFILLTIFFFSVASAQDLEKINVAINNDPKNATLWFERGEYYFTNYDYANAILDYSKAIDLNPNYSEAYFARGNSYFSQDNYKKALEDFNKSMLINPKNEYTINMIGVVYFREENYQEAITFFSKAIELNNQNGLYYKNRGNSLRNLKNYEEALKDYNFAINIDPNDSEAFANRASLYHYYLDQKENAIADYSLLLSKEENAEYYRNRADLYQDLGKYDLAEKDYSKLISLNPSEETNYIIRGGFYQSLENFDKAILDYTSAIKINPKNADNYIDRAWVYRVAKNSNLALLDLQNAINLNPTSTRGYSQRAYLYLEIENYEAAILDFTKIIDLEKNDYYHYINRASAYEKLKKYDLAEADYNSAIVLNPAQIFDRGMFFERIKKYELAEADYKKALEQKPDNSTISDYLANLYKTQGNNNKAIDFYTESILKNPQNVDFYISRAKIYYSLKKYEEGDADFKKAIQINPNSQRAYSVYAGELFQLKKLDKALEIINQLIKIEPTNTYNIKIRAQFYEAMKKNDLAEKDYTTIVNLSSNDEEKKENLQNRAFFYRFSKNYEKALNDYNQMISLFPDDYYIYENRASVYEDQKKYDLALEDLNHIIINKPNEISTYNTRSRLYQNIGKYDLALQDINFLINKEPKESSNYRNRAEIYTSIGKLDLAKRDLDKMISLDETGYAYIERGKFYLNNNQIDLAFQDYDTAIAKGIKEGLLVKGFANLWLGKYNEAKKDFEKLDNKENESSKIIITLPLNKLHLFEESNQYFANLVENKLTPIDEGAQKTIDLMGISREFTQKNYQKAIEIINKAQEDFKTDILKTDIINKVLETYLLSLKGFALENLENFNEAKQAYEQSLLINKNQPDVVEGLTRVNKNLEMIAKKDNNPPSIIILEPSTRGIGIDADKTKQIIKGKATHSSGIKNITINGKNINFETDGFFETSVNLSEGENKFQIIAQNNNGLSTTKDLLLNTSITNKPQNANYIPSITENPKYHAILIAESFYSNPCLNDLEGPIKDMRKIYKTLTQFYTFEEKNVDTLVNASRQKIVETLIKKGNKLTQNDNLLIFYAGHGKMITNNKNEKEGSLLPIDADCNDEYSQITTQDLKNIFSNIKDAKHILFFADACFAGTIFRLSPDAPKSEQLQYSIMSRELMTSGNEQPVPDESNFVTMFTNALINNKEKYTTSEKLFDSFKHDYRNETKLIPQHRDISNIPGSDGGRFVFIKK